MISTKQTTKAIRINGKIQNVTLCGLHAAYADQFLRQVNEAFGKLPNEKRTPQNKDRLARACGRALRRTFTQYSKAQKVSFDDVMNVRVHHYLVNTVGVITGFIWEGGE